jgi:DNA transformation protein
MKPFRPNAKQTLKSYYQVPVDVMEDADELREWAVKAIDCQRRSRKM